MSGVVLPLSVYQIGLNQKLFVLLMTPLLLLLLIICLDAVRCQLFLYSIVIFMVTAHMSWRVVCLPSSRGRVLPVRVRLLTVFSLQLEKWRVGRGNDCFFPSVSNLWNNLPPDVFPSSYNLSSFKRQVCHHFRQQIFSSNLFNFYFLFTLFFIIPSAPLSTYLNK